MKREHSYPQLPGYSYRSAFAGGVNGRPTFHARVRVKGWKRSQWITVTGDSGEPIVYFDPFDAMEAARLWAIQNENKEAA
jgi:hypothetical protein